MPTMWFWHFSQVSNQSWIIVEAESEDAAWKTLTTHLNKVKWDYERWGEKKARGYFDVERINVVS